MTTMKNILLISILILSFASCNALAPEPTSTPVPTATNLPTVTLIPAPTISPTPTLKPTQTRIPPTETPDEFPLTMPAGKPEAEWHGFPIMPNAIAGENVNSGYAFTIQATAEEVQKFYEKELAEMGYDLFATGEGETGSATLFFQKGTTIMSVWLAPQANGLMYVWLFE